jgi:opacity protein-like surface antigen
MRKIVLLCGLLLALSLPAMAQDQPRFDLFGGYSYVRVSIPTSGTSGNITSNLNGGSGAAAFYLNRWLGVVGDFGGYKLGTLKQGSQSLDVSGSVFTYLFGPRIRFGAEAFTPFAQVLFGGAHIGDVTCSTTTTGCPTSGVVITSQNAFGMTAGGGVDVKVARHFSIRGQAEYLMTKFTDGVNDRQNNVRISAGIVIH